MRYNKNVLIESRKKNRKLRNIHFTTPLLQIGRAKETNLIAPCPVSVSITWLFRMISTDPSSTPSNSFLPPFAPVFFLNHGLTSSPHALEVCGRGLFLHIFIPVTFILFSKHARDRNGRIWIVLGLYCTDVATLDTVQSTTRDDIFSTTSLSLGK